jgi:4-hydroxyphenylpyruvate dioxygenase
MEEPMNKLFNKLDLIKLDHIGVPQPEGDMQVICDYYFKIFDFHHFWSVDEKVIASELSSLRTTVVSDYDEKVKMPVFEPAPGQLKSQIQVDKF